MTTEEKLKVAVEALKRLDENRRYEIADCAPVDVPHHFENIAREALTKIESDNVCPCDCHDKPTPREKGTICKTGCPDCGYSIIEGIED